MRSESLFEFKENTLVLAILVLVFSSFFNDGGILCPVILRSLHSDSSDEMIRNIRSTKGLQQLETLF
jgi:hypothetical protein